MLCYVRTTFTQACRVRRLFLKCDESKLKSINKVMLLLTIYDVHFTKF